MAQSVANIFMGVFKEPNAGHSPKWTDTTTLPIHQRCVWCMDLWRGSFTHQQQCSIAGISLFLLMMECGSKCSIVYIDLISRGRENTDDYFPSLHIDRGAAEVNMVREIIKPVFSRPREIRVLSQEDLLAHH